ncbi:MAG TPA: hypothetical protein VKN63_04060 [Afifellaceae bacterium]|nr:hypothetical protein [Afifellaceae bacterium]
MSIETERCEDEVNVIRERMAMRIDSIAEEFAPQSLLARATGKPDAGIGDAIDLTVDTIRRNPISAALIGAGIAGVILSRAADHARTEAANIPVGDPNEPVGLEGVDASGRRYSASGLISQTMNEKLVERTNTMTESVKAKAENLKHQATETVTDAAETVREKASAAKEAAVENAELAGQKIKDTADEISRRTQAAGDTAVRKTEETKNWIKENPVATGLAVMAAGAAVGSVLTARRDGSAASDDDESLPAADAASADLHEAAEEKSADKDGLKGAERFDQLAEKAETDKKKKTRKTPTPAGARATGRDAAAGGKPVTAATAPGVRSGFTSEPKTSTGTSQS